MGTLEGKVALITGAGQGVGQGIALAMAAEGAAIAASGRTLSKLETACETIIDRGGRAQPFGCDVKNDESLEALVKGVVDHFGTIDILVNNAQEVPLGPLNGVSEQSFTAGWESGPLATFRLMRLCYPQLKGGGSIVNLGSAAAKRWDMANYGCYAAVKEAIRSLTRAAACEWAVDGIRTNVVLPHAKSPALVGWIDDNPEEAKEFFSTIPMRRVGECEEDIGRFVAMLCSDASAYINGQTIAIDGGQAFLG